MKGNCPSCKRTVLRLKVDDDDFVLVETKAVLVVVERDEDYITTYGNPVHSCGSIVKR